ncbi:hypothetical protein A2W14_06455 [Candidatus Gottesmanbacteria bacterium RBG_16_37_8]|uniref:Uncharacterized protein n=1 Tax=Candidatus Gottesmanbacteria bacterium RBG_16_37_8 TaxID=1798371 RepID=A0A1F5YRK8_9BACT|nr:MAG: hypothetical protein A2W14_06455 [Candidatus Gottesmanbacteria bacterium RBG_16_37_8]
MKKLKKLALFVFVLPITVLLDFILFSLTKSCPTCGSFNQWLASEGALSFPLVVSLGDFLSQLLTELRVISGNKLDNNS